ncbi:MAG: GNAT family N-acetyltransferase [Sphingobacteriales bacterium]|nr:GNAT family N-acetyltransferase [Sphingobacteriales bacterium]OJW01770.1 MAG: GNAT family N-acetyltransferase [Sphingobacteriales bacterium 44-61]
MNLPIIIEPLNNTHCQEIIDLILPIQQIEFNVPVNLESQPDLLDIETNYDATGGKFWGAFYGEKLVGTIALIGIGHKGGAIRKMFVRKEWRGKEHGIAGHLLEILIGYCKANDITDLFLGTVDLLNAAHRFYEKKGFDRIAQEDLPSYFPRMKADNMFYHLHLHHSEETDSKMKSIV